MVQRGLLWRVRVLLLAVRLCSVRLRAGMVLGMRDARTEWKGPVLTMGPLLGPVIVVPVVVGTVCSDVLPLLIDGDLPDGHAKHERRGEQRDDRRARHDHFGDPPSRDTPRGGRQEFDENQKHATEHEGDNGEQAEEIRVAQALGARRQDGHQAAGYREDQGHQPGSRPKTVVANPVLGCCLRVTHWTCSVVVVVAAA